MMSAKGKEASHGAPGFAVILSGPFCKPSRMDRFRHLPKLLSGIPRVTALGKMAAPPEQPELPTPLSQLPPA